MLNIEAIETHCKYISDAISLPAAVPSVLTAQSTTNSCSQNPIMSSASPVAGSHCRSNCWPSFVVAAWARRGTLGQISLTTFLTCSAMGGFVEQYGSRLGRGLICGAEAVAFRVLTSSCWNPTSVFGSISTSKSGRIGISKLERRLLSVNW